MLRFPTLSPPRFAALAPLPEPVLERSLTPALPAPEPVRERFAAPAPAPPEARLLTPAPPARFAGESPRAEPPNLSAVARSP